MKPPRAELCTRLAALSDRMKRYGSTVSDETSWLKEADREIDLAMAELMEAGPVVDDLAKQKELRGIIGKLFKVLIEIADRHSVGP